MTTTLSELFYDPRTGFSSKTSFIARAKHLGFKHKDVLEFLKAQEVAQLNKERGGKRHYFPIWGRGPGSYQCDLMFMDNPRNHAKQLPILNIIDVNSRMLYAFILKDKTNAEVLKALMSWVDAAKERPVFLQSDNGKEFVGSAVEKFLAQHGILHGTVEPEDHQGQAMVERVNETMRRLFRLYEGAVKKPWTSGFDDLVWNYNHRVHSAIDLPPAEATDFAGLAQRRAQYERAQKDFSAFHVGDKVRKLIHSGYFDKGKASWSTAVYTIVGTNGYHLFELSDGSYAKHYDLQLVKDVQKPDALPEGLVAPAIVKKAKKVARTLNKEGIKNFLAPGVAEEPEAEKRRAKAPQAFVAGPAPPQQTLDRSGLGPKRKNGPRKGIDPSTIRYAQAKFGSKLRKSSQEGRPIRSEVQHGPSRILFPCRAHTRKVSVDKGGSAEPADGAEATG